jgi:hypothetical protein
MSFRTIHRSALILAAVLVSANAANAATIDTVTIDGTLGPVLKGKDPAGLDGQSAVVTVLASESLKPYKTTATSASYHIPAGDITVNVFGTNYSSTSRSSMIVKLGKKADTLTFKATLKIDGYTVKVSDTSSLASGSWSNTVLQHPALFSPSPQNLSSPSSTLTYTIIGETTVLGVSGSIANSDASP